MMENSNSKGKPSGISHQVESYLREVSVEKSDVEQVIDALTDNKDNLQIVIAVCIDKEDKVSILHPTMDKATVIGLLEGAKIKMSFYTTYGLVEDRSPEEEEDGGD